jgi:serine/threonine protein kinase
MDRPHEDNPRQPPVDPPAESISTGSMDRPPNATEVLKQRYVIVRPLSHGGFGKVFLAHDRQLHNRPVVIKIQLDHSVDDPWFERKFNDELRALTLINHPGVVCALDSGRTEDGRPFLVMEYIEGKTLRAVLTPEGLPLDRAANLFHQVGQALGAAHDKKIWHRDLKPENIMLRMFPGGDEHVQLIDFGIATIVDLNAKQSSTRVAGSLPYMAPEQVTGQPTAETDIYAFGVIAYEALTGRKPFVPEDMDQLCALQRAGVRIRPSLLRPGVSPMAEKLILQALSYNPNERPNDAREFGDQLSQALLTGPPPKAVPPVAGRWGGARVWAAAGTLILLLGLAGLWLYRGRAVPPKPEAAATPIASAPAPAPGKKADPASPADSTQTDASVELAFWNSTSSSDDPRLFREYLTKYPNGRFASLAKLKLTPPAKAAATARPAPTLPAVPPPPRAGETRLNPRDGLQYVWVPAGSFQMGCSPLDAECLPAESPRHLVRLTEGFWIGQTEVTVEAWVRFAKATVREMPPEPMDGKLQLNPGWAQRRLPMDNISWTESKAYCTWTGGRLPTEAEWEYAARAGSPESRYGPVDEVAWYNYNSGNQPIDFNTVPPGQYQQRIEQNGNRPHMVATKRPNAWGLYDMLGNLNEWVTDWSSETCYKGNWGGGTCYSESPEVDPKGPETSRLHMWRGGNYYRTAREARVSLRGLGFDDKPSPRTGCRCVLDQISGPGQ